MVLRKAHKKEHNRAGLCVHLREKVFEALSLSICVYFIEIVKTHSLSVCVFVCVSE